MPKVVGSSALLLNTRWIGKDKSMIDGCSVLAVIPARGGSKGVPKKNIRESLGKPLIAWSIEAAKRSQYIDRVVLTSDCDEIISVAKRFGCEVPFKRPPELATDETPGILPVIHALSQIPGFDYVVLLQPTSPLRNTDDIDQCILKCASSKAKLCVSVTEVSENPFWSFTLGDEKFLKPLFPDSGTFNRRQDLPKVYALNGAVYVAGVEVLKRTKSFITESTIAHVMPRARSIDIDSEEDFELFEIQMKKRHADSSCDQISI